MEKNLKNGRTPVLEILSITKRQDQRPGSPTPRGPESGNVMTGMTNNDDWQYASEAPYKATNSKANTTLLGNNTAMPWTVHEVGCGLYSIQAISESLTGVKSDITEINKRFTENGFFVKNEGYLIWGKGNKFLEVATEGAFTSDFSFGEGFPSQEKLNSLNNQRWALMLWMDRGPIKHFVDFKSISNSRIKTVDSISFPAKKDYPQGEYDLSQVDSYYLFSNIRKVKK